jgi:meso-butanediol dehydrogenase / (S,S)-butanediol dehydrogenase / diacetyl reductase
VRPGGVGGRVALVTGGSSGIGRACARRLLEDGASVLLMARDEERLAVAEEELASMGPCASFAGDVSIEGQACGAVAAAVKRFGRLDVLVCAHGVLCEPKSFLELTDADWSAVLDVNLWGLIRMGRAAAGAMAEQRSGVIINVSSINAYQAEPGMAPYNVAKGALQSLTTSMAYDLYQRGIRVNAVAPGWVLTPMTEPYFEELADKELESNIVGRPGRAEEIAHVVSFLADERSSYIAGETITVDGGQVGILAPLRAKGE